MFHTLRPRYSATVCRSAAPILVGLAVAATPAGMEADDSVEDEVGAIAVELNRTAPVSGGCRLSFVIRNDTSHAFASLQWDLVFFDADDLIAGRMAAEAAPLPAGKTSVKLYDVPDLTCERLGRVLLNGVLRCKTTPASDTSIDCLRLTAPSSRATTDFMK